MMRITLVSGIASILMAIVLVQTIGMIGVAIAIAAGTILLNLSAWIQARRLVGVWTHIHPASLLRR